MKLANLFKHRVEKTTRLEVTGHPVTFSAFSGNPYENDVYRSAVDGIARIAAKFTLTPTISFSDGTTAKGDERLAYLLQVRPNALMTAFDMLYQLTTHLYVNNNAYCYIHRDGGTVHGFYPLHVSSCDFAQDEGGNIVCHFTFANGKQYDLPYSDVVHLRRHFNSNDVAGESNDAISAGIELADTQNEGIRNSIRSGANIRGLVKFTSIMSPELLKENKEQFVKDYLSLENSGGVVAVGGNMEYEPIESKYPTISKEDLEATRSKIFSYLGINEHIADSSFTDDQFAAFNESVLEALALQFSQEFTSKVYGGAAGRSIECSTSHIAFMSNERKIELIRNAVPMSIVSVNEAREVIGLEPLEEDKRIQSLNYASSNLVDEYQLFRAGNGDLHDSEPGEGAGK